MAITGIPESTTMLLLGTGIAGLAVVGRRRKKEIHISGL
ncbi:PEP-CTERM sorting domain-containing protein [Desulfogranum marinum]|nr:PEP-CTERM sorting domain-containing protein [Desulfogranum marinum]